MRRSAALAAALLLAPLAARAQQVIVHEPATSHATALIDSVARGPHVVPTGVGALTIPRGTTITSSLLVLGRPTYLAGTVQGDVVVVGADLFLRPGANISGRAVAVGGTVAETTLGHVGGTVQSLRDETFIIQGDQATQGFTLTRVGTRVGGEATEDTLPVFRLSGIYGLRLPKYDRVDGLSLPVGVQFNLAGGKVVAEPKVTYRSRLGALDPSVRVRVGAEEGRRFEGRLARDTRSNDLWITSELVNSLKVFAFASDTRNYFRSDLAEGRVFLSVGNEGAKLEPFAGARFERVSPATATGDVFSIMERGDSLQHMSRPNPLVERGDIGSILVGALYESLGDASPVTSRLWVEAEQSVTTPDGTSGFTQLTADGRLEFPTFSTHRLRFRGHAVASLGDSVPRARWAYLGGSRTLGLADLLQYGGPRLVFVESRYLVPLAVLPLPVVGPPTLSLIHRIGGAGVRSIGPLQQEVGVGLGVGSMGAGIDLEFITGASGQGRSDFGISVSLPSF